MNFANYTDIALAAVRQAKLEASKMGLPFAGTGHLLLGIAKAGGRAAKVMARAGIEVQAIKRELQYLMPGTEQCDVTCEDIGISGGFRAALDYTQCFTASSKKWVDDMSLLGALWAVSSNVSTSSIILKRLGVTWMDLTAAGIEKAEPAGGQVYSETTGTGHGAATWSYSVQVGTGKSFRSSKMIMVDVPTMVADIGRATYEDYMRTASPSNPLTAAEIYKMSEEMSKQRPIMLPKKVQYTKINSLPEEAGLTVPNLPKDVLRETAMALRSLSWEIVNLRVQTARHAVFTGDNADKQRKEYLQAVRKAAESESQRLRKLADRLDGTWEKELQTMIQAGAITANEVRAQYGFPPMEGGDKPWKSEETPKPLSWLDEATGCAAGSVPPPAETPSTSWEDLRAFALSSFGISKEMLTEATNVNPDGSFTLSKGIDDAVEQEATRVGLICPEGHHKLEGDCRYDYCRCSCPRCTEQCQKHGR